MYGALISGTDAPQTASAPPVTASGTLGTSSQSGAAVKIAAIAAIRSGGIFVTSR